MHRDNISYIKNDILPWESQELDPVLSSYQTGVWRVVSQQPSRKSLRSYWEPVTSRWKTAQEAGYLLKFLKDIYHLEPFLFIVYVLSHAFSGVNDALTLLYTNNLLNKVEHTITSSEGADVEGIVRALALHIAVKIFAELWRWAWRHPGQIIHNRIVVYCKVRVMRAHLSFDLSSSQDPTNASYTNTLFAAQNTLRSVIDCVRLISSTVSQIIVIVQLMKSRDDGVMIVGLCILYSLIQSKVYGGYYIPDMIYYVSDRTYRRLLGLFDIATSLQYKQEVIGGAFGNYLMNEYEKIGSLIPNAQDEPELRITRAGTVPLRTCIDVLVECLPLIFCTLRVIQKPDEFSLTYLATLQKTSSVIQQTLFSFSWIDNILLNITCVKSLYVSRTKEIPPGEMPFPPADSHPKDGMSIEMRDVSFQYVKKDGEKFALRNLSFKIPPSSLVVIVGANGSGKSSIVKLLAQLYRPTSGQMLINGQPADSYISQDLHNATALLTQNHSVFPLSIAENIGIGDPTEADNLKKIMEAARMGGASELIESFDQKWEQELTPMKTCVLRSYYVLEEGPLKDLMAAVERRREISGGESQRLAAARTFMRIMSEKTKLVIVDEPTSAIDPAGEYELFEQLRSMRAGKTMVFVTHRFGHLTKFADLILCMKSGELVESGTHRELMEKGGEYCKLYEVQANAFAESSP